MSTTDQPHDVAGGAHLFDLGGHDRIALTGAGAAEFLHRLLTADVLGLAPGASTPAFLLQSTGRIEVAFFLLRLDADTFWADVGLGHGAAALAALDRFLFAEAVALAPLSHGALHLAGAGAAAVLGAVGLPAPGPDAHAPGQIAGHAVRVAAMGRAGGGGFDVWLAPDAVDAAHGALVAAGAVASGAAALEAGRVAAGVPAWGAEYGPESSPLEVSGLRGVTERKGCYPGQEVIERTLTSGRPPRALIGLALDGPVADGAALEIDDRPVGTVTSVAAQPDGRWLGLALVKRRSADHDGPFTCGGVTARRRELG